MSAAASIINEEVARFDALGDDWWDPSGPMAPLHKINPVRIAWLRDMIAGHFAISGVDPLEGLTLLDIGCGAGLLAEPLSRMGARVTGLDPAPTSIGIARAHAAATGAELSYRQGTVEDLAKEGAKYKVRANVICPGFVRTPLVEKQIPEQAKELGISEEDVIKKVMLKETVDGEFTTVEDVAETAIFFAAFPSNALTGQSLVVSHGWFMQ